MDLELLFSMHLMTTQEWRDYLKVVYHPLLSTAYSHKLKYEKNFKEVQLRLSKRQALLAKVTA